MDDDVEVEALSVSTQNNFVRFDKDLGACQGYTIQIIPYTKENLDGELRQIEVETKAAVVNYEKVRNHLHTFLWIYLNSSSIRRSLSIWSAKEPRLTAWS